MNRVTFYENQNFVSLNFRSTFFIAAITSLIAIPAALIGYSILYVPLSAFMLATHLKLQASRCVLALREVEAPEKRANNAKTCVSAVFANMLLLIQLPNAALSSALFVWPDLLSGRGYIPDYYSPDAWFLDYLTTRSDLPVFQLVLIAIVNQAVLSLLIIFVRARGPLLALCNTCFKVPARYYDPQTPIEQQPTITKELTEAASGPLPLLAQFITTIAGVGLVTTYQLLWTHAQDAAGVILSSCVSCALVVIIGVGLTLGLVYIARSCGENYSFPTPPKFKGQ